MSLWHVSVLCVPIREPVGFILWETQMYFVVDVKVKDDLTDLDVLIELKQNVQCLK